MMHRLFRLLIIIYLSATATLVAIGFTPIPRLLAKTLHVTSQLQPADCVVVLGGGILPGDRLTSSSLERTVIASKLFKQGLSDTIILSSGITHPKWSAESEAQLMEKVLTALGIPKESIILEENSTRTAENAQEVALIMKEKGYDSALLVTTTYHMARAQGCFNKQGVTTYPVLASSRLEDNPTFRLRVRLFGAALHEYLGIAYYKLRGWI